MIGINVLTAIIIFSCCQLPAAQSDNGTGLAGQGMPLGMRIWFVPDSVSYFSYDSAGQVCDHDISCDSIFNRALRRAADNDGGRITLQQGVYPLSITLQLCSNLTLTGDVDAKEAAVLQSHSPQTILEGDHISHTTLSYFGIRNSLDRGGEGILLHNGSCHNLINEISVSHIGGNGNRITNSGSAGIQVADGVSHVVISRNYVNNPGCTVDHDQYGIYFGSTYATGNDITIDHNEVYNCRWEGIRVGSNSAAMGNTAAVKIIGNKVGHVVRQGIILNYSSNIRLSENDVRGASNGSASRANGNGVDHLVIRESNSCLEF